MRSEPRVPFRGASPCARAQEWEGRLPDSRLFARVSPQLLLRLVVVLRHSPARATAQIGFRARRQGSVIKCPSAWHFTMLPSPRRRAVAAPSIGRSGSTHTRFSSKFEGRGRGLSAPANTSEAAGVSADRVNTVNSRDALHFCAFGLGHRRYFTRTMAEPLPPPTAEAPAPSPGPGRVTRMSAAASPEAENGALQTTPQRQPATPSGRASGPSVPRPSATRRASGASPPRSAASARVPESLSRFARARAPCPPASPPAPRGLGPRPRPAGASILAGGAVNRRLESAQAPTSGSAPWSAAEDADLTQLVQQRGPRPRGDSHGGSASEFGALGPGTRRSPIDARTQEAFRRPEAPRAPAAARHAAPPRSRTTSDAREGETAEARRGEAAGTG